jgi:hypothetical protein
MRTKFREFLGKFREYHFELKHLIVVLIILIFFQLLISVVHKTSIQNLLDKTQDWYQQDSAERLANLSAISLELLLETTSTRALHSQETTQEIIQAFNIILSQPLLQKSVHDICVMVSDGENIRVIDDGSELYSYFFDNYTSQPTGLNINPKYSYAVELYRNLRSKIEASEQIYSIREGEEIFHVFVPFVPKGEFVGAVYVKNTPDFAFISKEIMNSYDETALLFSALILLGLLAMFYISSYTVKERNETQQQLFKEREKYLTEKINHQKETLFTKRIYHTHHKAEKIMGFIKEDLRQMNGGDVETVKYRVTKYANFISRVIYDMKWYDPPIQTIRNPLFRTNLNEVIRFLVENLFLRVSQKSNFIKFELNLDESLPPVPINEFVVWEIMEPLLQNSIDHSGTDSVLIKIHTLCDAASHEIQINISDNGPGIRHDLLMRNKQGVKRIFMENISTKQNGHNSGYGCYLAYEIARERCGWQIDAINQPAGGTIFTIIIPLNAHGAV